MLLTSLRGRRTMPGEEQRRATVEHMRYVAKKDGFWTHEEREAVSDDDDNHGSYEERPHDVLYNPG